MGLDKREREILPTPTNAWPTAKGAIMKNVRFVSLKKGLASAEFLQS